MTADPFADWRSRVEAALDQRLPDPAHAPVRLHAAMRHAVLGGGKRVRPLLVYATGTALGISEEDLDDAAVAVEFIHCYSLVHDDLPSMDDDALRRGRPTVHVAFDEATAILAGDALQALAFEVLAAAPQTAEARIAMLAELAQAAGVAGMCGGQALDIDATGTHGHDQSKDKQLAALERMHALKTGALLRCAVRLGALAAGADADTRATLDRYADALGLAFQIRDDLLDIEGDTATLGKTAGKDLAQQKTTFPALLGVEASRDRLSALFTLMQDSLARLGKPADALSLLARKVVMRDH